MSDALTELHDISCALTGAEQEAARMRADLNKLETAIHQQRQQLAVLLVREEERAPGFHSIPEVRAIIRRLSPANVIEMAARGALSPVPQLEIRRDSATSLHGRPDWVALRVALPAEIALGQEHPMFWLDASDHAYYSVSARQVSDRLARVR